MAVRLSTLQSSKRSQGTLWSTSTSGVPEYPTVVLWYKIVLVYTETESRECRYKYKYKYKYGADRRYWYGVLGTEVTCYDYG
jgi:hypothetical protein